MASLQWVVVAHEGAARDIDLSRCRSEVGFIRQPDTNLSPDFSFACIPPRRIPPRLRSHPLAPIVGPLISQSRLFE